jgi:hypothetical protein
VLAWQSHALAGTQAWPTIIKNLTFGMVGHGVSSLMGHVAFHYNILRHQRGARGLWRSRLLTAHILAGPLPHLQQLRPHDQGAAQAQLAHSLEAHHNHFRPCPAGKHKRWCWVDSVCCSAPKEVATCRASDTAKAGPPQTRGATKHKAGPNTASYITQTHFLTNPKVVWPTCRAQTGPPAGAAQGQLSLAAPAHAPPAPTQLVPGTN